MLPKPLAILLAGGRGRRFAAAGGQPFKQALPWSAGRSLLEHVCDRYAAGGLAVVCALHPELRALAHSLSAAGHAVVTVADADRGLGHTLAAAVAASPSPGGWLVGLADMPEIRPETIARVAAGLRAGAGLCVPRYRLRCGHPVGFAARFGEDLSALEGDRGGRALLRRHGDLLEYVDVDDPGVLFDIDLPADLAVARD